MAISVPFQLKTMLIKDPIRGVAEDMVPPVNRLYPHIVPDLNADKDRLALAVSNDPQPPKAEEGEGEVVMAKHSYGPPRPKKKPKQKTKSRPVKRKK